MVEVTIQIPEPLAERVLSAHARLPETPAHGLDELSPLPDQVYRSILEFIVSQPSAEVIMNFGPTAEMQARVNKSLRSPFTPMESTMWVG